MHARTHTHTHTECGGGGRGGRLENKHISIGWEGCVCHCFYCPAVWVATHCLGQLVSIFGGWMLSRKEPGWRRFPHDCAALNIFTSPWWSCWCQTRTWIVYCVSVLWQPNQGRIRPANAVLVISGWRRSWPNPCTRPGLASGSVTSSSPWSWSTKWLSTFARSRTKQLVLGTQTRKTLFTTARWWGCGKYILEIDTGGYTCLADFTVGFYSQQGEGG